MIVRSETVLPCTPPTPATSWPWARRECCCTPITVPACRIMPRRWPTAESPTVTPAAGRTCCRRNFPAAARRTTAPRQWCPNMPTAPRQRRLYSTVQKLMSANPSCPACPCSVTAMASKPFPFSSRTQAAFPLRYATPYTKPRTSSPARWSTPIRARSRSRCTKPLPFPSTLRRTRWSLLPSTAHGRQSVPGACTSAVRHPEHRQHAGHPGPCP